MLSGVGPAHLEQPFCLSFRDRAGSHRVIKAMPTLPSSPPNLAPADRYQLLADLLVGRVPARPIGGEAEWRELVSLARAERVGPLLDRALDERPEVEVPPSPRQMLAVLYLAAKHECRVQQSLRERLCRHLAERGIPM